jgi:hypothetical protein
MKRFARLLVLLLALADPAHAYEQGPWRGIDWSNVEITGGTGNFDTLSATDFTATDAEAGSLTVTTLVVRRVLPFVLALPGTSVATGDGQAWVLVPSQLDGYVISGAEARVYSPGVSGALDLSVRVQHSDGTEADAYTATVLTGRTEASSGAGSVSDRTLSTDDTVIIDVDAVHSGTAPKGLAIDVYADHP